jgi:predicted helicase
MRGARLKTFRQLLEEFDAVGEDDRREGPPVREFCRAYFQTDPFWVERFDEVWSWMDWPGREGG